MNYNDTTGKIPPHAIDVEKAVLGALILEPDAIQKVSGIIDTGSFYLCIHQKIFSVVKSLSELNKPIDLLIVTNRLRELGQLDNIGGPIYLTQLTNLVASAAHIEHHARIIYQKYLQREIIKIGLETKIEASEENADIDELINNLKQRVSSLDDYSAGSNIGKLQAVVLEESILEIEKDCMAFERGIQPGITTGLMELDVALGGWRDTNFIILASRPGIGKTSLALHFAKVAALSGKWVNFHGLEMNASDLMRILISAESGIKRTTIRDGQLTNTDWNKLNKSSAILEKLPIIWNDFAGITVAQIKSITLKNKKAGKCDLVIIDYLQLVNTLDKKQNREQQIAEISRNLKRLALSVNIPVIALCQLNREAENGKPQLHHLRESGSLEQDADIVIFPWRDDDKYCLTISKNRRGITGTIEIFANDEMTEFKDIPSLRKWHTS